MLPWSHLVERLLAELSEVADPAEQVEGVFYLLDGLQQLLRFAMVRLEVAFGTGSQHLQLPSKRVCRCLRVFCVGLGIRIVRIYQQDQHRAFGYKLM